MYLFSQYGDSYSEDATDHSLKEAFKKVREKVCASQVPKPSLVPQAGGEILGMRLSKAATVIVQCSCTPFRMPFSPLPPCYSLSSPYEIPLLSLPPTLSPLSLKYLAPLLSLPPTPSPLDQSGEKVHISQEEMALVESRYFPNESPWGLFRQVRCSHVGQIEALGGPGAGFHTEGRGTGELGARFCTEGRGTGEYFIQRGVAPGRPGAGFIERGVALGGRCRVSYRRVWHWDPPPRS